MSSYRCRCTCATPVPVAHLSTDVATIYIYIIIINKGCKPHRAVRYLTLFSNLKLISNIIWISMIYKYVLTHQPNLVSLYALGHLHAPRQPYPSGEVAGRHLKTYPGGYRGLANRDPTSQSPPHGASDSPQKARPGSPPKLEPGSPQVLGPSSPPEPASVSPPEPASAFPPAMVAKTYHHVSHYQIHMA